MADFSDSQIEDAKRRVEQMRNRARSYTNNENKTQDNNNLHNGNKEFNNNQNNISSLSQSFGLDSIFKSLGIGNNDENSKGSGLILALVLVLSYEKADSMLILALLYILL